MEQPLGLLLVLMVVGALGHQRRRDAWADPSGTALPANSTPPWHCMLGLHTLSRRTMFQDP